MGGGCAACDWMIDSAETVRQTYENHQKCRTADSSQEDEDFGMKFGSSDQFRSASAINSSLYLQIGRRKPARATEKLNSGFDIRRYLQRL